MLPVFDDAARGITTISFSRRARRRNTRWLRFLLTGFDPFDSAGRPPAPGQWNPSGAAAMALDGTKIDPLPGASPRHAIAIEALVLPVSFDAFDGRSARAGVVERAIGPQLSNLDAILTLSEGDQANPSDPMQLEAFAVGVRETEPLRTHPLEPLQRRTFGMEAVPPARTGHSSGPAILPSQADLPSIRSRYTRQNSRFSAPVIGTRISLEFPDRPRAQAFLRAFGPLGRSEIDHAAFSLTRFEVRLHDPRDITRLHSRIRSRHGADLTVRIGTNDFHPLLREGPGGNFLSNEVSYRTLRMIQAQRASAPPTSFHVHLASGDQIPAPGAGNARARRRSLRSNRRHLTRTLARLRALLIATAREILSRRASTP